MFLSIIIPAFNEDLNIKNTVKSLIDVEMPSFVEKLEIVIVDDCSTDNTWFMIQELQYTYPKIEAIHLEINSGKGAAVRAGFAKATGDVFAVQDADSELTPTDFPALLNAMNALNVEFVNGSRYLPGIIRPISSYKRYLANRMFTFFTSLLIDVKFTDMACGYKIIHRSLYEKLVLHENRFGFEAELIIKAIRQKRNNVAEVPVNYFPRNNGEGKKLKNSDGFRILWTVIKYGLFRVN